ncbi:MAG: Dabb family protein [Bacteroidia bacterium]|nr:Dabb family protein [Bacteroidia bacterium]
METQSRRTFLATASALTLGITTSFAMEKEKSPLVHHVFFWLKNPSSKEDLAKLLEGLRTLKKIETIKMLHIGVPASTEKRDVVDNSYSASELMFFDDLAGQKTYQDHPIHLKFIENCSHLWEKVIVYDAISA